MNAKFIATEGPIGVGKTTITTELTKRFNSFFKTESLFEIVEENPFLSKFYNDKDAYAFQVESFFLLNRYTQLKEIQQKLSDNITIFSDYHIMKNLIFASMNLGSEEQEKFKKLFNTFIDGFANPNIIIYSNGTLEEMLRRIKMRGRIIEKGIDPDYIDNLINKYDKFMDPIELQKYYPGTQLILIDADTVDFIKDPKEYDRLFDLVSKAISDSSVTLQVLSNDPEDQHLLSITN